MFEFLDAIAGLAKILSLLIYRYTIDRALDSGYVLRLKKDNLASEN